MSFYIFANDCCYDKNGIHQVAGPFNDLAAAEKMSETLTNSSKRTHYVMKLMSTCSLEPAKAKRVSDE